MITAYGDTSVGDLTAMLDEAFQDFPETAVSSDSPKNESGIAAQFPPNYRPVRIHKEMSNTDSGYGMLAGFGSVPRRTENYWTALAFEVLMADGPGSLLTQWLRNKRRWIYGTVSMTEAFSNWGSQYFLMRLSYDQVEEAVKYLGKQWQTLPDFLTDGRVEALRIEPGTVPGAEMGPLITGEHHAKVKGYVDLGVEEGADLVVDGRQFTHPDAPNGFFLGGCLFSAAGIAPQIAGGLVPINPVWLARLLLPEGVVPIDNPKITEPLRAAR